MFTVWQLLADFRAGKTISLVKSHATICFASYSAWQTRISRSPNDITLLWCRIQSFSEIENNKFVYGLQNWFVFVVALILDCIPLRIRTSSKNYFWLAAVHKNIMEAWNSKSVKSMYSIQNFYKKIVSSNSIFSYTQMWKSKKASLPKINFFLM